jgi:hypothetical protein
MLRCKAGKMTPSAKVSVFLDFMQEISSSGPAEGGSSGVTGRHQRRFSLVSATNELSARVFSHVSMKICGVAIFCHVASSDNVSTGTLQTS